MKRLLFHASLALILMVSGCSSAKDVAGFGANELISMLMKSIPGLNQGQAIAGAGSLLGVASQNMAPADFSSLSKLIPNTDDLIKEAANLGGIGDIKSLASAKTIMSKLGITPEAAAKFAPAIGDFITGKGGTADLVAKFNEAIK